MAQNPKLPKKHHPKTKPPTTMVAHKGPHEIFIHGLFPTHEPTPQNQVTPDQMPHDCPGGAGAPPA